MEQQSWNRTRKRLGLLCLSIAVATCGGGGSSQSGSTGGGGGGGSGGSTGGGNGGGNGGSTGGEPNPVPASSTSDVVTYHNDNARSGQALSETVLTPANVTPATFGKKGFYLTDGKVDAQPLYLASVSIPARGTHNVLYVATEHDSVYAFDADSGATLWQASLLAAGETPSDARNCFQVMPEIGITSTPVIDRTRGPNGAVYVIGMSKDSSGNYFQRLHALDAATGAELFGGPRTISASVPGTGDNSSGGQVKFDPGQYEERAGLLMTGGTVYAAWASHCDAGLYTGWIMAFDAGTLAQTSVLNITPNGSKGAIWMSGSGLAADTGGNIYFVAGNGTFDTTLDASGFPSNGDYGNAFIKLSTAHGLTVVDYFATFDTVGQSDADLDLGSGGALLLPDVTDAGGTVRHLAVGAGKTGNIYVVNRDAMGKFNPSTNNVYQENDFGLGNGVFSAPAYYNGTVYYGAMGDSIRAFAIAGGMLPTNSSSQTNNAFAFPGATPSISANGTMNGIVWAAENGNIAALHAYNAADLSLELYNSNQAAGGRDAFGPGNKFITPTIANGKVYVGATNGVAVFGLLP